MNSFSTNTAPRAPWIWTGRILSGFVVLFLLFGNVIKLIGRPEVAQTFTELGFPTKFAIAVGVVELVCIVLYAIPRTAVLGAVLLTALLGGAIATRVRAESPLFSHTLFGGGIDAARAAAVAPVASALRG